MTMQSMTPSLRQHHAARAQRLARFASKAVPDHGIKMRNGWPVKRAIMKIAPRPTDISINARFGEWGTLRPSTINGLASPTLTVEPFIGLWTNQIEIIIRVVCRNYGITRTDILSARRTANVVRPRQIAMWLCKQLTLRSLPDIGRRFGNLDHTTVLHAVRKIENLRQTDAAMAAELDDLREQIQARLPAAPGLE